MWVGVGREGHGNDKRGEEEGDGGMTSGARESSGGEKVKGMREWRFVD